MQHDVQELNRVLCEKLETKMKGTKVGCAGSLDWVQCHATKMKGTRVGCVGSPDQGPEPSVLHATSHRTDQSLKGRLAALPSLHKELQRHHPTTSRQQQGGG